MFPVAQTSSGYFFGNVGKYRKNTILKISIRKITSVKNVLIQNNKRNYHFFTRRINFFSLNMNGDCHISLEVCFEDRKIHLNTSMAMGR